MGNIGGSTVKTSNEKSEGKGGKQQNFHRFITKFTAQKREK